MYVASVSVGVRGAIRSAAEAPSPPLTRPEPCLSRSPIVIGRAAGTRSKAASAPCAGGRRTRLGDGHLVETFELRNESRDRIAQPNRALFDEHHDRDASDGLRHRCQPEQAVLRHRLLRLEVHHAARLEVRDAPPARDQRHRASDIVGVDVALDGFTNAFQPIRGETDLLGFPAGTVPATSGNPMSATTASTASARIVLPLGGRSRLCAHRRASKQA